MRRRGRAPDAEGVAEGDQADALDEAEAGVGALERAHGRRAGLEHQVARGQARVARRGGQAALVRAVDLIRQHVQQHLRRARPGRVSVEVLGLEMA